MLLNFAKFFLSFSRCRIISVSFFSAVECRSYASDSFSVELYIYFWPFHFLGVKVQNEVSTSLCWLIQTFSFNMSFWCARGRVCAFVYTSVYTYLVYCYDLLIFIFIVSEVAWTRISLSLSLCSYSISQCWHWWLCVLCINIHNQKSGKLFGIKIVFQLVLHGKSVIFRTYNLLLFVLMKFMCKYIFTLYGVRTHPSKHRPIHFDKII